MNHNPQASQACLQQSVYYPLADAGLLRLQGRDRLTFVQRQTTNNINLLTPQKGQISVLTSATARILDVFFAFSPAGQAEESLVMLPSKAAETARYLKNRIFFMDQVSLFNEGELYQQYLLEGPQAGDVLRQLGCQAPEGSDSIQTGMIDNQPITLLGWRGLTAGNLAYRLLTPAAAGQAIEHALQTAGAVLLDEFSREILRVEAGQPALGSELSEEFNPLEVGLSYAVSDNKGCYTGQEIIARQITYDKVTRQMVGLRLAQPVRQGSEVLCEDKSAGKVTSSVESPRFGPLALAVLKRPYFAPETKVVVVSDDQQISAMVAALPFV